MEIVVALAILGLSVAVTMELISGAFTNISRINQYFIASNHAENLMNELLVSPEVTGPSESNGVFEDGYRWHATVVERVVPPDLPPEEQPPVIPIQLLEMSVEIQWQMRSRQHNYVLKSMRVINNTEANQAGLSSPQVSGSQRRGGLSNFASEPANRARPGIGRQIPGRSGIGSSRQRP